jgi:hypothetical protein
MSPRKKEQLLLYLSSCRQYCHRRRAAGRWPHLPNPVTSLLRQRGSVRVQYTVLTSPEATLCSTHHLAKVTTLSLEYSIVIVTDYPLSDLLRNQDATGRISKWVVELGALNIDFKPCSTIKSQTLFNFMAEWRENQLPTPTERPELWVMYFDGSLKLEGASAGVLLTPRRANNSSTSCRSSGRSQTMKSSTRPYCTGFALQSHWASSGY